MLLPWLSHPKALETPEPTDETTYYYPQEIDLQGCEYTVPGSGSRAEYVVGQQQGTEYLFQPARR